MALSAKARRREWDKMLQFMFRFDSEELRLLLEVGSKVVRARRILDDAAQHARAELDKRDQKQMELDLKSEAERRVKAEAEFNREIEELSKQYAQSEVAEEGNQPSVS